MFTKKIGSNMIENALKGLKKVMIDLEQGINVCNVQIEENAAALEAAKVAFEKRQDEINQENESLSKSAEQAAVAKENIGKLLGL